MLSIVVSSSSGGALRFPLLSEAAGWPFCRPLLPLSGFLAPFLPFPSVAGVRILRASRDKNEMCDYLVCRPRRPSCRRVLPWSSYSVTTPTTRGSPSRLRSVRDQIALVIVTLRRAVGVVEIRMFRVVRNAPHRLWVRAQLFNLPECVVQLFLVMPRLFFE